jgi:hypothetical protein
MDGELHAQHDLDLEEQHLEEEEEESGVIAGWLSIAMAEYRTLRTEIIHSLALQQSCLVFGTLALGGLALAGFHDWSDKTSRLPLVIFLAVVPLVSYVNGCVWLGEYTRTARAGAFLAKIELKVNAALRREVLTWEQWLRTPRAGSGSVPQHTWNSWTIFSFFVIVVPGSSIVIAWLSKFGQTRSFTFWGPIAAIEATIFLGAAWLLGGVFMKARHYAREGDAPADEARAVRRRMHRSRLLVASAIGRV